MGKEGQFDDDVAIESKVRKGPIFEVVDSSLKVLSTFLVELSEL
jgi:hypothetical protein